MLRSMTGFGQAKGQAEGVALNVEIRAVNHRYYKGVIKVPEAYASIESEIDSRLRAQIQRGSLVVTVRMKIPDEQAAHRVNTAALETYVQQLQELETTANPTLRIDLGSLLLLPGVCEPPSLEDLCEKTQSALLELVEQAVAGVVTMREREGEAVKADLAANCDRASEALAAVVERAPKVVEDYHERLRTRVAELLATAGATLDADVLSREVAIFAERCDVAEEINRLGGHLEQFRLVMEDGPSAGRKLDFIAQEMLREANTIGSKANDSEITRAVVEIKTAVDRIKEQVQNVE